MAGQIMRSVAASISHSCLPHPDATSSHAMRQPFARRPPHKLQQAITCALLAACTCPYGMVSGDGGTEGFTAGHIARHIVTAATAGCTARSAPTHTAPMCRGFVRLWYSTYSTQLRARGRWPTGGVCLPETAIEPIHCSRALYDHLLELSSAGN